MSDRLYFRQLLSGRDYAVGDEVAIAMRNFTYVIGDRESGEAVLVDPAYEPRELVEMVNDAGLDLVGVFATHYHPDHVGGTLMGRQRVAGVSELVSLAEVPVHVQEAEVPWMRERAEVPLGPGSSPRRRRGERRRRRGHHHRHSGSHAREPVPARERSPAEW